MDIYHPDGLVIRIVTGREPAAEEALELAKQYGWDPAEAEPEPETEPEQ